MPGSHLDFACAINGCNRERTPRCYNVMEWIRDNDIANVGGAGGVARWWISNGNDLDTTDIAPDP